jgi:hypothetical protein
MAYVLAKAAILFAIDSGCITDWLEVRVPAESNACTVSDIEQENGHLTLCDCGGAYTQSTVSVLI